VIGTGQTYERNDTKVIRIRGAIPVIYWMDSDVSQGSGNIVDDKFISIVHSFQP